MNIFFGIIVGFLLLMLLVVVHEFGHFIMARKSGVEVEEFGIGFPPAAIKWQKKKGKWRKLPKSEWESAVGKSLILSLNFLPIGGFCKMKGESDDDKRPNSFGAASFWGKTKILVGGVLFNWFFAAIILTILAFFGLPHFFENQIDIEGNYVGAPVKISQIVEGSPAQIAGIEDGDLVLEMRYTDICPEEECPSEIQKVISPYDINNFNKKYAGETIEMLISRDEIEKPLTVRLNDENSEYLLGVTMSQEGSVVYRSTWSAPIIGVATTAQLTGETFRGIGTMLWDFVSGIFRQVSPDESVREEGREAIGKAGDSVTGPVGIIGMIFPAFLESGFTNLMFITALISVSLACMNVLPIPVLDGGRWLLIAIYRLRKKPLKRETEERIVNRAFMVLILLIILITVLDLTRFFK